jgi:hypothetical protein
MAKLDQVERDGTLQVIFGRGRTVRVIARTQHDVILSAANQVHDAQVLAAPRDHPQTETALVTGPVLRHGVSGPFSPR